MKAAVQHFPEVLFAMRYKVVLSLESVNAILKCDHSNESCCAVLCRGTVSYAVQSRPIFGVCECNPKV